MKKKILSLLLATMLLLSLSAPAFALDNPSELRHSVAYVSVWNEINGTRCGIGFRGTGFFVGAEGENPQYLITNEHVIDSFINLGSGNQTYMSFSDWATTFVEGESFSSQEEYENYVRTLAYYWQRCTSSDHAYVRSHVDIYFSEDDSCEAYLVEADKTNDFAILRLAEPTDQRAPLPISLPTEEMVGKSCYAAGFPGIADNTSVEAVEARGETDATVNSGEVSRLITETGTGTPVIQNTVMTHQGNSGGPLVFENGAVIGITTSSVKASGDTIPLHYAISMSIVKPALDRNSIPYELLEYPEPTPAPTPFPNWAIIAIIAGVVVIAAVLVLVLKKGKKRAGRDNAQMSPTAAPAQQAAEPKQAPSGDSGFRVQGVAGALEGKRTLIPATGSLVIGRNPQTCGVVLPENTAGVSGRHCALWVEKGEVWLKDLGSTHGTFVAPGSRLAAEQPVKLKEGDLFWLGSEAQSFVVAKKR